MSLQDELSKHFCELLGRVKVTDGALSSVFIPEIIQRNVELGRRTGRDLPHLKDKYDHLFTTDLCIATAGMVFSLGPSDLIHKCRELSISKGGDYETEEISLLDYFPEGSRDVWVLVWGKGLRLNSLFKHNFEANHESFEDNVVDLGAYLIWFAVLSEREGDERV